jgi:hypothetical protein
VEILKRFISVKIRLLRNIIYTWMLIPIPKDISNGFTSEWEIWKKILITSLLFGISRNLNPFIKMEWSLCGIVKNNHSKWDYKKRRRGNLFQNLILLIKLNITKLNLNKKKIKREYLKIFFNKKMLKIKNKKLELKHKKKE